MKKILICTPIYPPDIGGPATYTKELCERLGSDFEIDVITYGDHNSPIIRNTKLHIINRNLPLPIRIFAFSFKLILTSHKYDVIYVQNAVAAGFPVAVNKLIKRTPFILKFVGDESWERATQRSETNSLLEDYFDNFSSQNLSLWVKILHAIQKFVLRRADIVTTPSEYLGKAITRHYSLNINKVLTNYNASENQERVDLGHVYKNKYQACTTARLTKWKGIEGIIHASLLVKKEIPEFTHIIAGDGPELEKCISLAKSLGCSDYVKFLGKISREETYRLRKESAIYVLNSTYEGLPHTALTSFQAQIPMIATNIPGTNEAVFGQVSGLLVEPNNHQDLAEKIITLLKDAPLQEKLVSGGTQVLNEKFSWESHLKNLKHFIATISNS